MSVTSKKSIPVSAYVRSRLDTEKKRVLKPLKRFWMLVTTYQRVTLSRLTYQTDKQYQTKVS